MQREIAAENTNLTVTFLGIDRIESAADFAALIEGRTLPCLQDTAAQDVFNRWGAVVDDVFLLNADNEPILVYNVFFNDLAAVGNYADLRARILAAAGG